MLRRTALALLVLGLFVKCSAKSSCDASSCLAGCCDVTGVCQQGNDDDACGPPGSGMCAVCAIGSSCAAGFCVAPDAGSGGSGGSGGGTGGGDDGLGGGGDGLPIVCDGGQDLCEGGVCVDAVCVHDNMDSGTGGGAGGGTSSGSGAFTCSSTRTVTVFAGPVIDAGYEFFNWVELANLDPASLTDGGTWDALDLELYAQNQATQPVPGVSDLDGGDDTGSPLTYFSCGVCPLYYAGCGPNGVCAHAYLGVSGHVDVAQATQAAPGTAYATMSNVTLVEWNLADDRPVPDSGCVLVGAATFDAGW